uniref:Alpha-1,3-mannosyl-glycoprotein 4-beta-N-acetylglucosaminyltransferase A n=1 Tax=Ascaris suum TaxID=6253 RepID=F1L1Z6_ASCSU
MRFLQRRLSCTVIFGVLLSWIFIYYTTLSNSSKHFNEYSNFTDARIRTLEKELLQMRCRLTERDRELFLLRNSGTLCSNETSVPRPAISLPSFFDFLPHLYTASLNALRPAVAYPNDTFPSGAKLVIGIPTVARHNFSYLLPTLQSLISGMNAEERASTLLVVLIADDEGPHSQFVAEQLHSVRSEFSQEIDSGLLHIIVPPREWYPPDLRSIPATFDDSPERMYWRTKQNLDYIFLMLYCQRRGEYYLQLEDDILTKTGFVSRIHDFTAQRPIESQWFMLEFSTLGFIGKLFRSSDLPLLAQFIALFHREKPVDWLLDLLFVNRYCHPEKSPKQCSEITKQYRVRSRPSLFQHVGVHSSLAGKLQKLRERDFGKVQLYIPHANNPRAKISTSLVGYKSYDLESAYAGRNFFWSFSPRAEDYILFDFGQGIKIRGFLFRTGNPEHQGDILTEDASVYLRRKNSGSFDRIVAFNEHGTARADFNISMVIDSLKIVVHKNLSNWVIFNEISITAE